MKKKKCYTVTNLGVNSYFFSSQGYIWSQYDHAKKVYINSINYSKIESDIKIIYFVTTPKNIIYGLSNWLNKLMSLFKLEWIEEIICVKFLKNQIDIILCN